MAKQNIRTLKLKGLNPAPYNPRKNLKPGDPDYDSLAASMDAFGYIEPIVVNIRDGKNVVVSGHQRLKVLLAAGETEATCVLVDFDKTTEKAANLAMNKIRGDWSFPELADLLTDLDTGEFDMSLTGFQEGELKNLMNWTPKEESVSDGDGQKQSMTCPSCGYVFARAS